MNMYDKKTRAAMALIDDKIAALAAARSLHARQGGGTYTCDVIHGAIAALETAQAILADEHDDTNDALANVRHIALHGRSE